ncbi:MAG: PKD domain-containing protein [Candidatus Thermoplasmatota archaeon]|nr:PKD domain-containing protein [Candidatus Thermoplasmatota archaeon]
MGEKDNRLKRIVSSTMIIGVTFVLVFSLLLPVFSSTSETVSTPKNQLEKEEEEKNAKTTGPSEEHDLEGRVEKVKEIQNSDIWHSNVENPSEGPFSTNKTTVYLNLTGRGNLTQMISPFDWISSLDSSGSMDFNDPDEMRIAGAQHFVDLVEQNATGSRGASIDFDSSATLINGHHLSDNYSTIKQDLEQIDASGGTDFTPPLDTALDEFRSHGNTFRSWFHIFLTDGEGPLNWDLVDQHDQEGIPIYTIGFGDANEQILYNMSEQTGGEFYQLSDPANLNETFESIFDSIYENATSQNKTAVISPPGEPMIREVLPPSVEYIEGSAEPQENLTVSEDGGKTILEWDRNGLDINETWEVKYEIRATDHSHDLPITAYNSSGDPQSRISFQNVSSGEIKDIPTPGPELGVHGRPEPVIGASRWEGVEVGENITFKNMTWDGNQKSRWPGDCEISKYSWDFGDGTEGEGEMINHSYSSSGTYNVSLTATTVDGVNATVAENITIVAPSPPHFAVTIDSPNDGTEYTEGDNVTVEYTVENTGDETGSQNIEFYVDEELIETEEGVELSSGRNYSGRFNWTAAEPYGQRNLSVQSQNESDVVNVQITEKEVVEPYFAVSINSPGEGSEYVEGENVTVEYTVENTGNETDTQNIELYVDDTLIETEEDVELSPGGIHSGQFNWTASEPYGQRNLSVQSQNESDVVNVQITEKEVVGPYFAVSINSPGEGSEYVEGENVTVEYTVENTGNETDTQNIEFYVDDTLIETEEDVEILPGSNYSGRFNWTASEPYGQRDLSVQSQNESDVVNVQITEKEVVGPYFAVSINSPGEGSEYVEGENVTVEYTVENTGNETDTQNIEFYVDEELIETEEGVELSPGSTHSDWFDWTASEPYGQRDLSVKSQNESDVVNVQISEEEVAEPYFAVIIDSPEKGSEYTEGENVTVEYTVENTGNETGTQNIEFHVDGDLEDSEEITLQPGETQEREFTWEVDNGDAREHALNVASEDEGDEVSVAVEEKEASPSGESGDLGWLVYLIPIVIALIVIAAWTYSRYKGTEEEEEPTDEDEGELEE